MQRPSKKPGFCFKIWHPLEKSIWAQKGPNNEQFGAITFPLPMNYLICRASDETAGLYLFCQENDFFILLKDVVGWMHLN
jgi:hypothetical protein